MPRPGRSAARADDQTMPPRPETAALVLAGAARALAAVVDEGLNAEVALAAAARTAHRAAIHAVTLGALRWYLRLAPAVLPLLARPRAGGNGLLRSLLVCAAHQLEYSQHAPATTVAAAVDAARLLGLARAAGLVNAVLRRYLRERTARLEAVDQDRAARSAHPDWLVAALRTAWPGELEQILAANNAPPPLTVRLDLSRTSLAGYLEELAGAGLHGDPVAGIPTAVTLDRAVPVSALPGFAEGRVSVQDASAQLAALWLAPRPGERVLDACAAPGGKTGALLEIAGGAIDLTALEADAGRLARVGDNLRRLGRSAKLVHAELGGAAPWWDGRPFDAILLDAPCSGSGVIRRHPDIKLLRRETDIPAFAARQQRLGQACLALLRPGGRLLYATCSVLPAENAAVAGALLAVQPGMRESPPSAAVAACLELHPCRPGWQLLPGAGGDGFYYACLRLEGTP
jgi:16S rRNA (cytosine967-C5)-methyltransferase